MEKELLKSRIKSHAEWVDYYLSAYERGIEVGSVHSAERARDDAAKHAAILTALLAISAGT